MLNEVKLDEILGLNWCEPDEAVSCVCIFEKITINYTVCFNTRFTNLRKFA